MLRAVEEDDGARAGNPERDDRPRVVEHDDQDRERRRRHDRRQRREPRHEKDDKPDADAAERDERCERQRRASGGRDHLAALLEPEEHRPGVTDHGRSGREDADERSTDPEPEGRCGEALRDVEQGHRDAEAAAVHAEDVRRADVAAAPGADVLLTQDERHPVAERQRAEEVPAKHGECVQHGPTRPESSTTRSSRSRRSSRGSVGRPRCRRHGRSGSRGSTRARRRRARRAVWRSRPGTCSARRRCS